MLRTIVFASLLIAGLGSAFAQDLSAERVPCQSAQKLIVVADRDRAVQLLDKAIAAVQATGDDDIARYERWFGAPSSSKVAEATDALKRARSVQLFSQIWCPNASDNILNPSPTENGRVYPTSPGEIFVGPNFFNLPFSGLGSRAGTIVHEWMHLAGFGLVNKEVYSVADTLALAKNDSAKARDNANNFRYFAEESP